MAVELPEPPHSLETEQAALGCALISRPAAELVTGELRASDFYHRAHQQIHRALGYLVHRGEAPDPVTLADRLETRGELDDCGGRPYLSLLWESVPTASHAKHYVERIAELATLRELLAAAREITTQCQERTAETAEILDAAERRVLGIGRRRDPVGWTSAAAGVTAAVARACGDVPQDAGVPTGFRKLDQVTNGLQRSDLILLAARPGIGKTALALTLGGNAAAAGFPVDMFSLEMSERQLWDRLLCAWSKTAAWQFRAGLGAEHAAHVRTTATLLTTLPLTVCDRSDLTIEQIRGEARRGVKERGTRLVIVDYLQRVRTRGHENRNQELGEVARGLKSLAKDLDLPVLAISSLSRQVQRREGKRPELSDLRDCGELEYEADAVWMLHREVGTEPEGWASPQQLPTDPPETLELWIKKFRNGPNEVVIPLLFQPACTAFYDLEGRYDPDDYGQSASRNGAGLGAPHR